MAEIAAFKAVTNPAALPARNEAPTGRTEFPCSLAQQRFWILEQLDPGNPALNVAVRWRLEGDVSQADLEEAWRLIIDRHQILRTYPESTGSGPIQIVEPSIEFRIPVVDLTALSEGDAMAEAERLGHLEARTSFRLSVPPLIRVTRLQVRKRVSILLVTAHHIICDGWSIGILAQEMGEIYAALRQRSSPTLLRLSISYGDYAAEQRRRLATEALTAEADFWRRSLDGVKQFEILPDHPRPPVQTSNGSIRSILLDRDLTAGLVQLSRDQGCTLFMTALSTLLVLLHRHTGETDIAIGTQAAGRPAVELEDLVGPFINTIVLRNDVSGEQTFLALLEQVRDSVMDAFEHQQMPFEKVVEMLNPARDLGRNALFSVNFIFQRSFIKNADYGDLKLVDLPSCSAGALYDLNFFMVERPEGWRASCEFNTDLFDAQTIDGFLARWQTIMRAATADPSRKLSALPVLSAAERNALLAEWRGPNTDGLRLRTLPELFAEQVVRTPDETAVVCGDRRLTYRELENRSNRLARELQRHDVVPGSMVGVYLDRSPELLVALLAILKAGGAYVPLDPSYPQDRTAYIIGNARPALLVTRASLREHLAGVSAPALRIDEEPRETGCEEVDPLDAMPSPEDLAYVIYTSGSTGLSKGVQIQHKALTNLLCAMREQPGMGAADRLVAVTTVSFDIAALEMFLPLIVGARLIIAREQEATDGRALLQLLNKGAATVMQATPATWQMLIAAGWNGEPRLKMLCGGERLSRKLAGELLKRGGELWNMYGPTEATIWCSALRVEPEEGPVPIGPPIANTQFYVLDGHGKFVAPGVPGELFIGGAGLARGYLGLPELTRERFLPDKFQDDAAGAKIYRTGDIVRMRPGRRLEFLGRDDRQIKLRGYRIELGEIEATLLRHPGIAEAVAVVGRQPSGDMAIWVYIAPGHGKPERAEALIRAARSLLGKFLPAHMHPSSIQVLSALPRTPNGKIDQKALPAPGATDVGVLPAEEPLNELERHLARIWSSVLGIEKIGRSANFFDIGGNSLIAARLLSRVRTELERSVSLSTLFRAPSIEELAKALELGAQRQFDFRQVVKLRANGSKPPIIAINSTGMYHGLSVKLAADYPFTAIQAFDPSSRRRLVPQSFEGIAAEYARLILRVQPKGPYTLLGWCVGGALAFEVGQQLLSQGREVALLVLIDSWVPGYLRRLSRANALLADYSYRLQLIGARWLTAASRQRGWPLFRAGQNELAGRRRRVRGVDRPRTAEPMDQLSAETFDEQLQRYLEAAAQSYEPKPYPGRVLLLRSAQQPKPYFLDYELGWPDYVMGRLVTKSIAGDHFTMFREPGVQQMSEHIAAGLSACANRDSDGSPTTSERRLRGVSTPTGR